MNSAFTSEKQLTLPFNHEEAVVNRLPSADAEERGAVYTRREVVDFILDLSGYTSDKPLHEFRLLEPSFGEGDFLLSVVERLLCAYETHTPRWRRTVEDLYCAIRAVEIHESSITSTRERLLTVLESHGISSADSRHLLEHWIIKGDFLLVDLPWRFTHAVGNPPYVRQELVPAKLMERYRARYSTIYDRADLYVPFIERCLRNLEKGGVLGFICADRWMKNRYGGPLRGMVATQYHLAYYVDMVDTPAFHSDVIAYPAITIIERAKSGPTRVAHRPNVDHAGLTKLAQSMRADSIPENSGVVEVSGIVRGKEPWIVESFDTLRVVRRLEADFPLLEEAGCSVGIGVATGADKVFIGQMDTLDVEPDRKLPLVMTRDIEDGTVTWRGLGVINPFAADSSLVELNRYPKLARYFEAHAETLRKRNCAKKNPRGWYRTIDRIYPDLTYKPKLLIPDIKGEAHIVYEDGNYYPHHNLYFITSGEWDLRALQTVLLSGIAKLFVSTYSTQMRGGFLRFQAQYLRRIRLPRWKDVPLSLRNTLADTETAKDAETCSHAVSELYRLTSQEMAAIAGLKNSEGR